MERHFNKAPGRERATRHVHKAPDRPRVITSELDQAMVHVNLEPRYTTPNGFVSGIETHLPSMEADEIPEERARPLRTFTPQLPQPFTESRIISSSGRPFTIGGGTSRETIRRARRKASR